MSLDGIWLLRGMDDKTRKSKENTFDGPVYVLLESDFVQWLERMNKWKMMVRNGEHFSVNDAENLITSRMNFSLPLHPWSETFDGHVYVLLESDLVLWIERMNEWKMMVRNGEHFSIVNDAENLITSRMNFSLPLSPWSEKLWSVLVSFIWNIWWPCLCFTGIRPCSVIRKNEWMENDGKKWRALFNSKWCWKSDHT